MQALQGKGFCFLCSLLSPLCLEQCMAPQSLNECTVSFHSGSNIQDGLSHGHRAGKPQSCELNAVLSDTRSLTINQCHILPLFERGWYGDLSSPAFHLVNDMPVGTQRYLPEQDRILCQDMLKHGQTVGRVRAASCPGFTFPNSPVSENLNQSKKGKCEMLPLFLLTSSFLCLHKHLWDTLPTEQA